MNTELFKEYIELDKHINALTNQKENIKIELLKEMKEEDVDNVQTDDGTFYIKTNKKYQFSEYLSSLEDSVKKQIKKYSDEKMKIIKVSKEGEIANEIATVEESSSVVFRNK